MVPRRNVRRARGAGAEVASSPSFDSGGGPVEGGPRARASGNRRSTPTEPPQPPPPGRIRRAFARLRGGWRLPVLPTRERIVHALQGVLKLAVVVGVLVGMGAMGRLAERYVRTSPAFAIREIRIEGISRLQRDEVLRIGGVVLGSNVFEMPPEDVRVRLERHPWIADASVRRRLPGTLELDVRERRAAAVLVVDRSYLVGEDATVFKSLETGDPSDLPVITLEDRDRWLGDRQALGALLLDIVSLLHEWRRTGLETRATVAEVHVESDDGLALYVGDDAMQVRLGRGPYDAKLRRLRTLLDEMRRREARPAYVLLDHERRPERVVVRLRETVVPLPPMGADETSEPVEPTSPQPRPGVRARRG